VHQVSPPMGFSHPEPRALCTARHIRRADQRSCSAGWIGTEVHPGREAGLYTPG